MYGVLHCYLMGTHVTRFAQGHGVALNIFYSCDLPKTGRPGLKTRAYVWVGI